ncbi:EutP/PduV family microcompartment system protein [Oceanobacillus jeddahense]|uniref:EutP/PduV family microcompartment system protein n=1 Tax=Oceanobacillus jeddahense TaxID=1462527 RepID=A0ABY5JVN9_9BACI|nr:EutP/PduV family microcompartment system protein [Oceanobacillus jeddahense]UUI03829.1 EutP/PduV family microcompartment system protein [Oceanobacillus jeddahense]
MPLKNRAMILGGIDAGKTTLKEALFGRERQPKKIKTQSLIYEDWIVDTPGEYTENPLHYRSIMATSLEITHVLFVQDATNEKTIFAPGFSLGINKLPIGVVTKADASEANIERAIHLLKKAIVKGPIVITSAFTEEGIDVIPALVECQSLDEMRAYVTNHPSENLIFYENAKA